LAPLCTFSACNPHPESFNIATGRESAGYRPNQAGWKHQAWLEYSLSAASCILSWLFHPWLTLFESSMRFSWSMSPKGKGRGSQEVPPERKSEP
jgi:hypothetical protein